ncbi:MAG TPA: hypothetical protein VIK72_18035 [Clostridiaceae bacterium]
MVQLLINDVIIHSNSSELIRERILWLDLKYEYCFTILLGTNKTIIKEKLIKDVSAALENCSFEIATNDLIELVNVEEHYEDRHKESMNKKFDVVKYMVTECPEPYIFNHKYRGKVVDEAAIKFGLSHTVIYKYLRLYWQGGKLKSSLLPKYNNSGAPGREKNFTKKTGRPSYEEVILNKRIGIVLTEEIKNIFDLSLSRYYRNPKEIALSLVYKLMKKDFFTTEIDGELIVNSREKIPSFNQFYYWVRNRTDIRANTKKRIGARKYDLKNRELPSNTLQDVLGPGSRYEIDSTPDDIYLVSRLDKSRVIGRPTTYMIVDVFSRLITGVHISFEAASWNGSASTIYNCTENKVKFCLKFGIEITSEEWPSQGLPNIILADRGELIGPIGEPIISKLSIVLENTPTGRGDRKPIVEQTFHRLHARIKALLPGAVKKNCRERGERDYKLDARLDIFEYTQIVLIAIKNINKSELDDYQLTREMLADGVKAIPIKLWEWGMVNRTGKLRTINEDILKFHLMKHDTASITERGIKYRKILYTTKLAKNNGWYELSRIEGYKNIPIVYDDRDMTFIYIYDKPTNKYIQCELKDEYLMFANLTLDEIKDFNIDSMVQKNRMQDYTNQINVDLYTGIDKVISNNDNMTKGVSIKISRVDMKNNKKIEIKHDYEMSKKNNLSELDSSLLNEPIRRYEIDNEITVRELEVLNKMKIRRKTNGR